MRRATRGCVSRLGNHRDARDSATKVCRRSLQLTVHGWKGSRLVLRHVTREFAGTSQRGCPGTKRVVCVGGGRGRDQLLPGTGWFFWDGGAGGSAAQRLWFRTCMGACQRQGLTGRSAKDYARLRVVGCSRACGFYLGLITPALKRSSNVVCRSD